MSCSRVSMFLAATVDPPVVGAACRRGRARRRGRGRRRSRPRRCRPRRGRRRRASCGCRSAAGGRRRRCPAWSRRCAWWRRRSSPCSARSAWRVGARRSCASSGSSSAATSRTASSSRSTTCGKASRKKPEMRTVTSMRGRPSSASGIGSRPVTRRDASSQTGPHAEQREDLGDVVARRCAWPPCPRPTGRPSAGSSPVSSR